MNIKKILENALFELNREEKPIKVHQQWRSHCYTEMVQVEQVKNGNVMFRRVQPASLFLSEEDFLKHYTLYMSAE